MPFLLAEILNFQGSIHRIGVGSFSKIINQLAENGVAIIMISSEMPEIIGMSDRVIIMREGQIMGELSKNEICEENLIKYSMGVSCNANKE